MEIIPLNPVKVNCSATRHGWRLKGVEVRVKGGELSASRPCRALPPGKEPPVPTVQEAGWAPEPVWTQRLEENFSASVEDRTPSVQSAVRHYTDWATRLFITYYSTMKKSLCSINYFELCQSFHIFKEYMFKLTQSAGYSIKLLGWEIPPRVRPVTCSVKPSGQSETLTWKWLSGECLFQNCNQWFLLHLLRD
jgi:hypothetical protein